MAVRMRTTGVATFTATGDWADAPTYTGAWIGTNFIGADDIPAPQVLRNEDSYTIPIGTPYDWTITPDDGAAGDADAGIAAIMSAGADEVSLRFSLHSGDPGPNGTDNEIAAATNPGYSRQTAAFAVEVV